MSTRLFTPAAILWAVCVFQVPAAPAPILDENRGAAVTNAENPLFIIAKGTIVIFCERMQREHNVNIHLNDVLKQGTQDDAIRFADTLNEFEARGLLDQFMRESAPKMRAKYGPFRK